jgi:hypothetical protein
MGEGIFHDDASEAAREIPAVDNPPHKVGRPRSAGPRTSTAVRLPDALHDRLNTAAIERDVSLNFLMVKAVEQFLDRLIPVEEMRWTRD